MNPSIEMNEEKFELIEALAEIINFGDGKFCRTRSLYCGVEGALWNYKGWADTAELWNPLTSTEDAVSIMLELGLKVVANRGEIIRVWSSEDKNPVYADSLAAGLSESALKLKFRRAVVVAALIRYSPETIDKLSKQC